MGDRAQLLNDPEEAMRLALDGRQGILWTALPGIVTAVDLEKLTCSVQPAIQGTVTLEDGKVESVNLPLLLDVPIVFPSAGGFTITFPLAVDDEVLVIFSSRCIDSWWQSGGIGRPMEARMHDLSDGFAIPGPKSVPNVPGSVDGTNMQIRNNTGTAAITLTPSGDVIITGNNITLMGAETIAIQSPSNTVLGETSVLALFFANTIATNSISVGGVPFATHRHTGVTTGGGNTGGPI